ncbi:MAG: ABC transporter permease subunit [Deltaproteobacteria bacterium]|nr:ABC transporter permease subunit [Deltaproteobacteria bacterium]
MKVDILYDKFDESSRNMIDALAAIVTIVISVLIIYMATKFVGQAYVVDEGSPDPGGLPHRWLLRSFMAGIPEDLESAALVDGASRMGAFFDVILPQALTIMIPPLTSQYLNLTKNSSLAVAIAYPELVSVFAGTVLNQTGQAIEVIAMTMAVYLTISLLISLFMNWYNRRVALERR